MKTIGLIAAAAALTAVPVQAQSQQNRRAPATASTVAQQAMSANTQPDVLLDIPNLSVDEITLEVDNLQARIALDAQLANLLKLSAGAEASIDKVKLTIKGVQAQATLVVRLENVRAIIERTLQTIDNNPEIVRGLLSTVNNTVGTVGGVANRALPVVGGVANRAVGTVGNVANRALPTVGGVVNNTVGTVGGIATSALQNGQLLDLGRAGLTEVSRTTGTAGQIVRQVRDTAGNTSEVVTDQAGRIVSSRRVAQ
ncbi:MAG: hypothetical protein JWN21_120 [Sphingomonas bacterium]|uniref:hypothetical protein n=1 Tax=Sphingomonas bacterium TaxID=1895847 RepID=UPI00261AFA14|nr:hypothetical protein [Sphingomonas bacterium]MDB5694577.1 hypothetical protein [Sphingomonas bacterium]